MEIQVALYGEFRKYHSEKNFELELPEDATVRVLLSALGIPEDPYAWANVNGARVDWEHRLEDGDLVMIFPPSGGG